MRPNALTVVLAVNLAAAAGLAWLWSDADRSRWTEPAALPPSLDDVATTPVSEPADISHYRETLERPLFASSRKIAPRSAQGADTPEAVDPLKDVRLLGTYGAGGQGGVIVVRSGKVERVPVGASIGDWKVTGEDGRGVALTRSNGERRRLELTLNSTAPTPPAEAGKPSAKTDATEAGPAAVTPRVPDAVQPVPAAAAKTAPVAGQSDAAREKLRRDRIDRVNARRAERGLPPLPE